MSVKARIIDALFWIVGTLLLRKVFPKLTENAVIGWADDKIGDFLGWSAPDVATALAWVWPAIVVALLLWAYHGSYNRFIREPFIAAPLPTSPGSKVIAAWFLIAVGTAGLVTGVTMLVGKPLANVAVLKSPFVKNVDGPPIDWRFDKPVTIFFYSRKPGQAVWIEAVQIHATNKSDFALKNVSATMAADMQDSKLAMRVNPHGTFVKPEDSATLIPPRASFDLMLPMATGGLSAEDFLARYGALKFSFQFEENGNKTSYSEQFSLSYLEDQIAFIEEKTRLPARPDKKSEIESQEPNAILGPTSAGIELASIGLIPPNGIEVTDEITVQSLSISFLNICNSDGKQTLFRRSWTALCGGRQIERKFSHHRFYMALENKSVSKTLRNARLLVKAVDGPGGRILNDPFLCDSTETGSVDILPGASEYFLIGEGSDGSDAGMFHPRIVNSGEYDRILMELDSRKDVGFLLKTVKATYTILKNDGEKIHVTAYADDTAPVNGLITLNARSRIEIWLSEDGSA